MIINGGSVTDPNQTHSDRSTTANGHSNGQQPEDASQNGDGPDHYILRYPVDRPVDHPSALGAGARIRSNSVIYDATVIGTGLNLGHNVVIREECVIGDDVSIWSNSFVDYGCRIGNNVKIHVGCYVAQFTVIEDGAFLAPGVTIANDLYPGDDESAKLMRGPIIKAGAQIGAGATILPYVTIGERALVGSGSVVTRDVPAGMVCFGSPAVPRKAVADLDPIAERAGASDQ